MTTNTEDEILRKLVEHKCGKGKPMNDEIEILINNRIPTSDEAQSLLEFLHSLGVLIKKSKLKHYTIAYAEEVAKERGY